MRHDLAGESKRAMMRSASPMIPVLVLTVLALCLYAYATWAMLRRETPRVLLALSVVVGIAAVLRSIYVHQYPFGLNQDEAKILIAAWQRLTGQERFFSYHGESGFHLPLYVMFHATVWTVASYWWAVHLYPAVCGVLAVIGAFAVCRALGQDALQGLFAAGCIAVVPWALLYSRTSVGAEMTWHELIVLWALLQMLADRATWREAMLLGFALVLLIYDYFAGRAVLFFALATTPFMPRWRNAGFVVLAVAVALLCYSPAMWQPGPRTFTGLSMASESSVKIDLHALPERLPLVLRALWQASASLCTLGLPAGASSPVILIILAATGIFYAPGRAAGVLLLLFVFGLVPIVLGGLEGPISSHRMLMALCVPPLAAPYALGPIRDKLVRIVVATALLAVIGYQSVTFYFSSDFWTGPASYIYCNVGCTSAEPGTPSGLPPQCDGRLLDDWRRE
jgi:hypothetical protein